MNVTRLALRDLAVAALALLLGLAAAYCMLNLAPGGPLARLWLTSNTKSKYSDRDITNMERMLGLDEPVALRYVAWLVGDDWLGVLNEEWAGDSRGIMRGDFGKSWTKHKDVSAMVRERLPNTLVKMAATLGTSLLLAIPIGLFAAGRFTRQGDGAFRALVAAALTIPPYWLAMLLVIVFTNKLHEWGLPAFPPGGTQSLRPPQEGTLLDVLGASPGSFVDRAVHLVLPVVALALPLVAGWAHFVRGLAIERRTGVAGEESGRGSRGRFRRILIPAAAMALFQLPALFGVAVLTETEFSYPGMARLYVEANYGYDLPVMQAYLTLGVVLTVGAVLASTWVQRLGDDGSLVRRLAPDGTSAMELAWDFHSCGAGACGHRWREAGRLFARSRLARVGLAIVSLILAAVLMGPYVSPYIVRTAGDPSQTSQEPYPQPGPESGALSKEESRAAVLIVKIPVDDFAVCRNLGPLSSCPDGFHVLGTDRSARDYLSRIVLAGRRSLFIGIAGALLATMLGAAIGALGGLAPAPIDRLVVLATDGFIALPRLPIMMMAVMLTPADLVPGSYSGALLAVLVAFYWMPTARHVRDRLVALRSTGRNEGSDGGAAAAMAGLSSGLAPMLLTFLAGISSMMLTEAALSFLGFGVFHPEVSWGSMLRDVQGKMFDDPFEVVLPVLALATTCFAINLLCTSARSALEMSEARQDL
jgi:peptide/nickel transport system permease protein